MNPPMSEDTSYKKMPDPALVEKYRELAYRQYGIHFNGAKVEVSQTGNLAQQRDVTIIEAPPASVPPLDHDDLFIFTTRRQHVRAKADRDPPVPNVGRPADGGYFHQQRMGADELVVCRHQDRPWYRTVLGRPAGNERRKKSNRRKPDEPQQQRSRWRTSRHSKMSLEGPPAGQGANRCERFGWVKAWWHRLLDFRAAVG